MSFSKFTTSLSRHQDILSTDIQGNRSLKESSFLVSASLLTEERPRSNADPAEGQTLLLWLQSHLPLFLEDIVYLSPPAKLHLFHLQNESLACEILPSSERLCLWLVECEDCILL